MSVREFRDNPTRHLSNDVVLAIERHGHTIGFCIPTGASPWERFAQAPEHLEETVRRVHTETGLSEEELSCLYDLKQPLPEQPRRRGKIA